MDVYSDAAAYYGSRIQISNLLGRIEMMDGMEKMMVMIVIKGENALTPNRVFRTVRPQSGQER